MGEAIKTQNARLFSAITYPKEVKWENALAPFCEKYGAIAHFYGPVDFDQFTRYYSDEMGYGLMKTYISFDTLIDRGDLAEIKNFTNNLEQKTARNGNRTINIDPGYITNDKLVLASTKDFYHRIYLSDGIFAEVTLHYRRGRYRKFSWTYNDYFTDGFISFLEKIRSVLVRDSRKSGV